MRLFQKQALQIHMYVLNACVCLLYISKQVHTITLNEIHYLHSIDEIITHNQTNQLRSLEINKLTKLIKLMTLN